MAPVVALGRGFLDIGHSQISFPGDSMGIAWDQLFAVAKSHFQAPHEKELVFVGWAALFGDVLVSKAVPIATSLWMC